MARLLAVDTSQSARGVVRDRLLLGQHVCVDTETRAALAHHEAGHAVVNVVGGLIVDGVTVTDAVCHTAVVGLEDLEQAKPPRDEYRRRAEPYLIGQLAGGLAEQRYTGLVADSGGDDRVNAAWLGIEICPESEGLQAYLDRMSAAAATAVAANWPAIQAVAKRLAATDHLSRADLDMTIRGA